MNELLVDTPARMAEMHKPIPIPDLCAFEGACGSPLQRCPLHQQDVACMLEAPGAIYSRLPVGFQEHITLVETGENLLQALRWCWHNGCDKERPGITEDAQIAKVRIAALKSGLFCKRCKQPAEELLGEWCRGCSYPTGDCPVEIPAIVREKTGPDCDTCGQELLLVREGRTTCERCRIAAKRAAESIDIDRIEQEAAQAERNHRDGRGHA